jgi:uncharacterized protein YkwD
MLKATLSKCATGLCMILLALPVAAAGAPEAEALALINAHRVNAGCRPLAVNSQLQAAATAHATAMAEQNFFSHTGKDRSTLRSRVRASGYGGRGLAENIAAGQRTAAAVVSEWTRSPGHRRNILECSYSRTGLAQVYQADDLPLPGQTIPMKYYWVQVFGK